MKRASLFAICLIISTNAVTAQPNAARPNAARPDFVPNYDETKVGTYTLPDPLQPPGTARITTAAGWTAQRTHWLNQYAQHVFGQTPAQAVRLRFQVRATKNDALGGRAIRKQVAIFFTDYPQLPPVELLLYVPKNAKKPVPAFLGLNFCGNHCVSTDADLPLSDRWVNNAIGEVSLNNRATEKSRGMQARRWPIDSIVGRGYALATAYYGDIEPDHVDGWKTGIRSVLGDTSKANNWGSIGAWAWGMSRLLDYLQTDPLIDARRVIAIGHSRIGKAALWAGAQNERFAAVIANESGEAGAALARRTYGETVGRITTAFPHWFAATFATYANRVADLPVDQHILLSLIAPRPLYVASAEGDRWADPTGEFLGLKAAEPVYALFGKPGVNAVVQPPVNAPVTGTLSYHVRTGIHDVTNFDWRQYLRFADEQVR